MPSAAAFEFLTQVTTIFKQGAQRHALMRWRAALDKVSLSDPIDRGSFHDHSSHDFFEI